jgi:hypothetical protein
LLANLSFKTKRDGTNGVGIGQQWGTGYWQERYETI